MDLREAVIAAVKRELGIHMTSSEEAQQIYDICEECGLTTEYIPVDEVPGSWEVFFGTEFAEPVFYTCSSALLANFPNTTIVEFSDLSTCSVDTESIEALL